MFVCVWTIKYVYGAVWEGGGLIGGQGSLAVYYSETNMVNWAREAGDSVHKKRSAFNVGRWA
jgi:hypothetical protein